MEIADLIFILNVVRFAFFVVTFTGYSILFPSTVSRNRIGYSLCGLKLTTIREYVAVRPTGILLRATKRIVFVPFLLLLAIDLQVVQIILIVTFSRGVLFLF